MPLKNDIWTRKKCYGPPHLALDTVIVAAVYAIELLRENWVIKDAHSWRLQRFEIVHVDYMCCKNAAPEYDMNAVIHMIKRHVILLQSKSDWRSWFFCAGLGEPEDSSTSRWCVPASLSVSPKISYQLRWKWIIFGWAWGSRELDTDNWFVRIASFGVHRHLTAN